MVTVFFEEGAGIFFIKRVNLDEMSNADELCEEGVGGVQAGGELRTEAGAGCDASYAAFCA